MPSIAERLHHRPRRVQRVQRGDDRQQVEHGLGGQPGAAVDPTWWTATMAGTCHRNCAAASSARVAQPASCGTSVTEKGGACRLRLLPSHGPHPSTLIFATSRSGYSTDRTAKPRMEGS